MLQHFAQARVATASTELHQHVEANVKAIASQLPSATYEALQGIRIDLRDVAFETALNIQKLSQQTVEAAFQMGQWLWQMQRDLKRSEYRIFLSILGWATAKARKFINLAKTFDGFQPSQLIKVELTTLLSLCSSRYLSVVAQLQQAQDITQELVERLIKESRPAQKLKQDRISGWKQSRSGGGRYYNVLLHDEETGVSIEQQAAAEGILPQKVIASAIALRAQHKSIPAQPSEYVLAQMQEFQEEVGKMRVLHIEKEKLEIQLQEREKRIAELEAELAQALSSTSALKPEAEPEPEAQPEPELEPEPDVLRSCTTWEEIAKVVERNRGLLVTAVKDWTPEEKYRLVDLFAAHLENEPSVLDTEFAWVPKSLQDLALSTLSFTITRISDPNNLIDEPEVEYIHGCRYVSLEYPGSLHEQWIFADRSNKLYPVFGRGEFVIEQF